MDSIVKALTIQYSVDDLTGGAWSVAAKEIKAARAEVIALNQAWELGTKIYETVTSALKKPVEMLSAGGEYAEARAGFASLADSYSVDGKRIVDSIRDITEGNVGLQAATQAASYAITKGYSAEETETIWRFAKKYTDTMGGNVIDVADKVEKAILYHQEKVLKTFDTGITKSDDLRTAMSKLIEKTESMEGPAFNFGEAWRGMGQAASDALLSIEAEFNNVIGGTDFEGFAQSFRESMREIEDDAPGIVQAIWAPFEDLGELFTNLFNTITDGGFNQLDSLKIKLDTFINTLGNTYYDIKEMAATAEYSLSFGYAGGEAMADAMRDRNTYNEKFLKGKSSEEVRQEAKDKYMDEWVADLDREWEERLAETGKAESASIAQSAKEKTRADKETMKAAKDAKKAEEKEIAQMAKEANREWAERAKEEKEAVKAAEKAVEEKVKSYETIGDTVKSLGQIMGQEQQGINKTAESLANLYSGDFGIKDWEKERNLKTLLSRQEAEKEKEREILERQAEAQRELAKALTEYTKTPKVVEFRAPNDPNMFEALIQFIINFLNEQARAEGAMVQA